MVVPLLIQQIVFVVVDPIEAVSKDGCLVVDKIEVNVEKVKLVAVGYRTHPRPALPAVLRQGRRTPKWWRVGS